MRRAALTDAQKAEITRLRKSDPLTYTYTVLSRMFGCSASGVHMMLNPEKRKQYNESKQKSRAFGLYQDKRFQHKRHHRKQTIDRTECGDRRVGERPDPEQVLRMLAAIPRDRRDLTSRMLGDPLFERSALYQKMGASACSQ